MKYDLIFFVNSVLLGIGLAMDAFSVSVANGLAEPQMRKRKMLFIAGTFAVFQFLMPMAGWLCVHTIVNYFKVAERFVPYIALALLGYIGGEMIYESIRHQEDATPQKVGAGALFVQGIATSIDALSVGFTTEKYTAVAALLSAAIIGAVTFGVCWAGILIGKKFGNKFSDKATLLGGLILVGIGLEIFIKGII